jgi:Fe2+ or Zn2+ uptake regulation protein
MFLICKKCGSKVEEYTTGGYYPWDDDREWHVICPKCGEIDPTDLDVEVC